MGDTAREGAGEGVIFMVFTGGTISMALDPRTGAARPALRGADLLALAPELDSLGEHRVDEFGMYPGPHMDPARMLDLARHVEAGLAEPGTVGAVVAHGTDTLEETSYLLDLVLRTDRPVVFTGAMKTSDEAQWDGRANLWAAGRVAIDPDAAGRGVLVVLDSTIHAAAEVTKMDTEAFGAFRSPWTGPVGHLDLDRVYFRSRPESREHLGPMERLETRVDLVAAFVGADDRFLQAALDGGARAIVLEAFGRGNIPPAMLPGVRAARDAGVPVVVTSRCAAGRVGPRYGYDGGGAMLQEIGCILAGGCSSGKARIRLMVLLGAGAGDEALRAAFELG